MRVREREREKENGKAKTPGRKIFRFDPSGMRHLQSGDGEGPQMADGPAERD